MEIESQKKLLPNVLITGTPGTGKSTISKLLVDQVENLAYVGVGIC